MSSPPSGADPDGVANVSVTDAVGECGAMNGPTIATSTTKPGDRQADRSAPAARRTPENHQPLRARAHAPDPRRRV